MDPRGFDQLAPFYRVLEYAAFGRDLERARFCFLNELRDRREILVLGEGDGRCLQRLARLAPAARIDCLDLSQAMLDRAAARLPAEARPRVSFRRADLLSADLPAAKYDAAVTLFFLDCFQAEQAANIVGRIGASLKPGACWLWADFVLPPRGLARWRAKVWLAVLYAFFRWQTGIPARELPPVEALLIGAGLRREKETTLQWEFIRSAVFRRIGT